MGWPQIIWIILATVGLTHDLMKHGERKTGTHSFWSGSFAIALMAGLLYWGGFFG